MSQRERRVVTGALLRRLRAEQIVRLVCRQYPDEFPDVLAATTTVEQTACSYVFEERWAPAIGDRAIARLPADRFSDFAAEVGRVRFAYLPGSLGVLDDKINTHLLREDRPRLPPDTDHHQDPRHSPYRVWEFVPPTGLFDYSSVARLSLSKTDCRPDGFLPLLTELVRWAARPGIGSAHVLYEE